MNYGITFTTDRHGGYTVFFTDKIQAEENDKNLTLENLVVELKARIESLINREVLSIDGVEVIF